jgi:hypothetical protein
VGLQFGFDADQITVLPVDLAGVDGLADRIPLPTRIIHLLRRGPLSYAQIAEELGAKTDSVIKAVTRGTKAFTKVSGQDGVTRIALLEQRAA